MRPIFNFLIKLSLAVIYLLILTPVGLLLRLVGVDYLKKHFDRNSSSYWLDNPQQMDNR